MGTIAEKLAYTKQAREEIRSTIVELGVDCPGAAPFCEFDEYMRQIRTGVDTSEDTVTEDAMLEGITAHDAFGEQITGVIPTYDGTASGGLTVQVVETIPAGCVYYVGVTSTTLGDYTGATKTLTAGEAIPETAAAGDVYVDGDYEYRYAATYGDSSVWNTSDTLEGWGVRVLDNTKTEYGAMSTNLSNGIKSLSNTFSNCANMTCAPIIPDTVENMESTFGHCTSLTVAPSIPTENAIFLFGTFLGCTSLATAPYIPKNVTTVAYLFNGCTALTGTVTIDAEIEPSLTMLSEGNVFTATEKPIMLAGTCHRLLAIQQTSPDNVTLAPYLFVAYQYGSSKPLPTLPEYDKEKYPYAVIVYSSLNYYYRLIATSEICTATTGMFGKLTLSEGASYLTSTCYYYDADSNKNTFAWSEPTEGTTSGSISTANSSFSWSNYDLFTSSGTAVKEASDPVPIYPAGYSYNGITLPALPDWDSEAYPYVYIAQGKTKLLTTVKYFYMLYLCAEPMYWGYRGTLYSPAVGARMDGSAITFKITADSGYNLTETEWSSETEHEASTSYRPFSPFWANTDIYYVAESEYIEETLWGTLYLVGTDSVPPQIDGYLYNGTRLPALPEWDKETYPYAVIESSDSTNYYLYVTGSYRQYNDFTATDEWYSFLFNVPILYAKFTLGDEGWSAWKDFNETFPTSTGLEIGGIKDYFIWTNTNLYYGDVLAYKASEPVPVYD